MHLKRQLFVVELAQDDVVFFVRHWSLTPHDARLHFPDVGGNQVKMNAKLRLYGLHQRLAAPYPHNNPQT